MAAKTTAQEPWFTGKELAIWFYRFNRRPLPQPSLFDERPDSVLDHVAEVLLFGEPIITGRAYQREWILGARDISVSESLLTGQVGWEAQGSEPAAHYDKKNQRWAEDTGDRPTGAFSGFAFDAETRTLGVLRHPSFSPKTMPVVFERLLRRGEEQRQTGATVEWSVEPVGDTATFLQWVGAVDAVRQITLVAKLPNPDGLEEFAPVWPRLEARKAKALREIMEAADPDVGLVGLEQDEVVKAFLAMGESAFGYVTAKGTRDGNDQSYDQRTEMAQRQTPPLPSTWAEMLAVLIGFVRERRNKDAS